MKKMLSYYIKKRWYIIVVLSLILTAITSVVLLNNNFIRIQNIYENGNIVGAKEVAKNSPLGMLAVFAALLATIVPIFEFYFKMSKISIDQFYSLPIKKEKLYFSKYIISLLEIVIPITVSFITTYIFLLIKPNIFDMKYFFIFYILLLLITIMLFTCIVFIYTRCNTFFDGLINILGYSIVLVPIVAIVQKVFNLRYNHFGDWSFYFLYSPITRLTVILNELFINKFSTSDVFISDYIIFHTFIILSIIAFVLFIKLNKNEKAENSMQISKSRFAYKFLLPTYIISLLALSVYSGSAILLILVIVGGYLGYVIYKRSFKLSKYDYYCLLINLAFGLLLGFCIEL